MATIKDISTPKSSQLTKSPDNTRSDFLLPGSPAFEHDDTKYDVKQVPGGAWQRSPSSQDMSSFFPRLTESASDGEDDVERDLTTTVNLGRSCDYDLYASTGASKLNGEEKPTILDQALQCALNSIQSPTGTERITDLPIAQQEALEKKWQQYTREDAQRELDSFELEPLTEEEIQAMSAEERAERDQTFFEIKKALIMRGYRVRHHSKTDTMQISHRVKFQAPKLKKKTFSESRALGAGVNSNSFSGTRQKQRSALPSAVSVVPPSIRMHTKAMATAPGSLIDYFTPDIDCLVLEDKQKLFDDVIDRIISWSRNPTERNSKVVLSSSEKYVLQERWRQRNIDTADMEIKRLNPPAIKPEQLKDLSEEARLERDEKMSQVQARLIRRGFFAQYDPETDTMAVGEEIPLPASKEIPQDTGNATSAQKKQTK